MFSFTDLIGSSYLDELVSFVSAFLLLSELDLLPHNYDSIDYF